MRTKDIISALKRLKIQTGSIVCLGCGREHNCGIHGCAIMREAAARLEVLQRERDEMYAQLRKLADCSTCKNEEACGFDSRTCAACGRGENWEWGGRSPGPNDEQKRAAGSYSTKGRRC